MIVTISTRVLIASLGLLAFATSASAECAWILWSEVLVFGNTDSRWTAAGVPTAAECYKSLKDTMKEQLSKPLDPGETREVVGSGTIIRKKRGDTGSSIASWSCLPDTVDPRGPKGK